MGFTLLPLVLMGTFFQPLTHQEARLPPPSGLDYYRNVIRGGLLGSLITDKTEIRQVFKLLGESSPRFTNLRLASFHFARLHIVVVFDWNGKIIGVNRPTFRDLMVPWAEAKEK
jgi:hypothetical protein